MSIQYQSTTQDLLAVLEAASTGTAEPDLSLAGMTPIVVMATTARACEAGLLEVLEPPFANVSLTEDGELMLKIARDVAASARRAAQ